MGYIYKITNDINDKIYIGLTSRSLDIRFKEHLKDSKNDLSRPLYRAMNKYGTEHFTISLIEEVPDEILSQREQYWISKYNTYQDGYNATIGGDGQTKLNYQEVINLYNHYQNVREVARQLNVDRTSIEDILHSKNIPVLSPGLVTQQKLGKCIAQLDLNTEEIINVFPSCHAAAKALGVHHSGIARACNGERKSANGYKWKILNEWPLNQ